MNDQDGAVARGLSIYRSSPICCLRARSSVSLLTIVTKTQGEQLFRLESMTNELQR